MVNRYNIWALPPEEFQDVKGALKTRCDAADIPLKEINYDGQFAGHTGLSISFKCGRELREIEIVDQKKVYKILDVPFEKVTYLAGYEAICIYDQEYVEALVRSTGVGPASGVFEKLFGVSWRDAESSQPIRMASNHGIALELSLASDLFQAVNDNVGPRSITLKVSGVQAKRHDTVLDLLQKISGSLLFQIELVTGVALFLRRHKAPRSLRKDNEIALPLDLRFPDREFDEAPLSLYWYARSASGMPLLQYLAFYQVIEFYYPIYSRSEAHRRLKAILKNPAFRYEKDSDIAKLLSAIQVSRSGGFGDERSQLKATIDECVDEAELRDFLSGDEDRKKFLSEKSNLTGVKLSTASASSDLKNELARRIYELRCKIVHTKTDARDEELELLLPFSKEADQMHYDIELIQYVAQQVLVTGSRSLVLGV